MRLKDMFSAMKTIKSKKDKNAEQYATEMTDCAAGGRADLSTVWSEEMDPDKILTEYPRPQLRRQEWICLNGYWEYAFTQSDNRPQEMEGQILVPFSPESRRSGVGKRLEPGQYLWYRRDVQIQKLPGKRLLLHFGAVDQKCAIWWNGTFVNKHENGYLPFTLDITGFLKEGRNSLWVRVQDDTDAGTGCRGKQTLKPGGMFYTAQSGIWQTVWMEWVPENRIESLRITPLFDERKVRVEITLTAPEQVSISVLEETHQIVAGQLKTTEFTSCQMLNNPLLSPGCVEKRYIGSIELEVPDAKAWSPEHPYLYNLTVTAGKDSVDSYFAMRKFSVGLDEQQCPRLMLNNEPYFFNGVLDQGYWPETLMTPPSDEAMIFDIEQMKRLGFSMIRKHIKIEPLRWYYHCDRIGMIVWQDMINGGGPIRLPLVCYLPTILPLVKTRIPDSWYTFFARTNKKNREQWEIEALETIQHLYNCPSIGLWVPFNEGWGQYDSLRITDILRRADPTRLIDHASGWFDQGGGDVKSVHNYFNKLKVEKEKRPFVLSEYGGYVCPIEGHLFCERSYGYRTYNSKEELTDAGIALQKNIHDLIADGLCGTVYTQVSDIEEEINGLFTYDRKICKVLTGNK